MAPTTPPVNGRAPWTNDPIRSAGPRQPLRIMGRNVVHLLPIPPIALRLRTGIAMLSYANELAFGITADFDAVPDVEELSRGIERGLVRLVAISDERLGSNATA